MVECSRCALSRACLGSNERASCQRNGAKPKRRFRFRFVFPYVCPEPVLVKSSVLCTNGLKKGFSAPGHALIALRVGVSRHHVILVQFHSVLRPATYERRHSFFEFCLCLSRACLGKLIGIYMQRAQKRRFSPIGVTSEAATRLGFSPSSHCDAKRNAGRFLAQSFLMFDSSRVCLGKIVVPVSFFHQCMQQEIETKKDAFPPAFLTFTMYASTPVCPSFDKTGFFWSFPYVCPEPVLVKSSFLNINGPKSPFSYLSRRHPS